MGYSNRFVIFLLVCGNFLHEIEAKKKEIKYVINYNSGVTICDDDISRKLMTVDKLRAVRVNESIAKLEGEYEILRHMNGDMKIHIVIEKVTDRGNEVVASHTMADFCKELKNRFEETNYSTYLRAMSMPNCPIPPGVYTVTDMVTDTRLIPVNALMVGSYRITFNYYNYEVINKGFFKSTKDTFMGCLYFDTAVEPEA